jgi:hypothetical protein
MKDREEIGKIKDFVKGEIKRAVADIGQQIIEK